MPVFMTDELDVLFVHVPKTGGTTIERLFARAGWTTHLRQTSNSHPRLHKLRRTSPQHMHAAMLREQFWIRRFDFVFLIVRDPISRFRSEYVMRNKVSPELTEAAVDAWAENVWARFARDPYTYDNHIRPQSEFLLDGAQVYRIEDGLDTVVEDLNKRFDAGLSTDPLVVNASHLRSGVHSSDVPISAALEARLREFYAADFERFGY